LKRTYSLKYVVVLLIIIGFCFNGCKPPPPPPPEKPEYYSPVEIKPITERTSLAIPTVENAIIGDLEDTELSLKLRKLTDQLQKDFEDSGRFNVVPREKILDLERERERTKNRLINMLADTDLVLYLLAISFDEVNSEIHCGVYLVVRKTKEVVEKLNVKFNFEKDGDKIEFDKKQTYEFALDFVRKFPRFRSTVAYRAGKEIKVRLKNVKQTFVGQEAVVYNKYSPLDPKFVSYEYSYVPVSEVVVTEIREDHLLCEVIRGDENEIEIGDIVIFK